MKCGDDLVRFMIKIMTDLCSDRSFSDNFAEQIERQIYAEYSGQAVYIPKIPRRDERRDTIMREFNGRNRKQLCEKYAISKSQFYRMLKGW